MRRRCCSESRDRWISNAVDFVELTDSEDVLEYVVSVGSPTFVVVGDGVESYEATESGESDERQDDNERLLRNGRGIGMGNSVHATVRK